ncbi:hypothetical protein B0H14DRAFT_2622049 [Mycena olivaceomarginata]|nr:hypothetical protein B0H14DRAFT_2622049 [Mycena olivaceomarginata]
MLQRRTFAVFGVFRGVFVVKSALIYRITELEYMGWDWDEQRRHSGSSALQEPVGPVNGQCKLRSESKELRLVDEQMVASRRGAGGQKQPRGSEKIEWAGGHSHALRSGGERQPGKRSGGKCANPWERFPKSLSLETSDISIPQWGLASRGGDQDVIRRYYRDQQARYWRQSERIQASLNEHEGQYSPVAVRDGFSPAAPP